MRRPWERSQGLFYKTEVGSMKYEVRSRRYESSLATGGYSYLVLHTSYFMLYAIIPNDISKLSGGEGLRYLGNKFYPLPIQT
jgi:hypothetical protein